MLGFGAEGNFDGFRIVLSVQGYLLLSSLYRGAYGTGVLMVVLSVGIDFYILVY